MAYTLIQSYTLGSNSNTVTFSSIPQTYVDLSLVYCGRTTASGNYNVLVYTNISSTYSELLTYNFTANTTNTPAGAAGSSATAYDYFYQAIGNTTANTFGNSEVYFRNYATSRYKKHLGMVGVHTNAAQGGTGGYNGCSANLITSTTAISSITLQPDVPGTNNFVAGSTFYLYGIS